MKRPPGLPRDLETEITNAVTPILMKYRAMGKHHMDVERIAGIASGALSKAFKTVLWPTDHTSVDTTQSPSGQSHPVQESETS